MKKNKDLSLLASCNDLPEGINVYDLEPFLLFMPGTFENTNQDYQAKLIAHFQEIITILTKNLANNKELVEKEREHITSMSSRSLDCPTFNPFNCNELIKYKVLGQKNIELDVKLASNNLAALEHLNKLLSDLLKLTSWLLCKPRLIFINLKRAILSPSTLTYTTHQHLFREHRAIRLALKEQINLVNTFPPYFGSPSENKNFVRSAVDTAIGARKGNTSYFEESPLEDVLFSFFDMPNSPLSKAKLVPITIEGNQESVTQWLNQAIDVIVNYDHIENTERKEVISVYMIRYLFSRTYPRFKPELKNDLLFSKAMNHFAMLKPADNNIPNKYVPKGYENRPTRDLFESSSITQAPKEWLNLSQFKNCPLDVAYCIFKVHESLSIMVTLQASNGEGTQEFFNKMPGFDDIIDIWIALVCSSDLADPQGIYSFIFDWSRLPGFPSRFMNCITYLEAAIQQISSHKNDKFEE